MTATRQKYAACASQYYCCGARSQNLDRSQTSIDRTPQIRLVFKPKIREALLVIDTTGGTRNFTTSTALLFPFSHAPHKNHRSVYIPTIPGVCTTPTPRGQTSHTHFCCLSIFVVPPPLSFLSAVFSPLHCLDNDALPPQKTPPSSRFLFTKPPKPMRLGTYRGLGTISGRSMAS